VPWAFTHELEPYAQRAVPLLSRDPAAYSLGLTIIATLRDGLAYGDAAPTFGWLEEDGEVRGVVSRTPPYDFLLSIVPDAGELAAAMRADGIEVSGVNGEEETVEAFSAAWRDGTDLQATTFLQLRLFTLGELEPPDPPPPGRARLATEADLEVAMRWFDAFSEELGLPERMQEERVRALIADAKLWFWEDGEPVALALRTPTAAGVTRIICVYTPPELRGRGYAGAITAATCADALAGDAERVVLFTDRTNPGPNKVYQRIGFRPVADHLVVHFT
jgi:RimJ/RimL family protein N-acetyltransferase